MVDALLEYGADPSTENALGISPLATAATHNRWAVALALLRALREAELDADASKGRPQLQNHITRQ